MIRSDQTPRRTAIHCNMISGKSCMFQFQNGGYFERVAHRSVLVSGCIQGHQYHEQQHPTLPHPYQEDDLHRLKQPPNPISLSGHNFPPPLLSTCGSPLSVEVNSSRQCLFTFPRNQVPCRSTKLDCVILL